MAQFTAEKAFQMALGHHQAGRLPEAERIYRQVLAQAPGHAPAMHYLGVIAHQAGRNDEALGLVRRAIAVNPDDAQAYNSFGNFLVFDGKTDQAIAAYHRAVTLAPDYAEAHLNLGGALKDKGQLDDAVAAYRRAIALRPDFPEAFSNLGAALKAKGQRAEAITAYHRAIALRPGYAEAHYNLANAHKDAQQLDEAIAGYRRAIALRPDYVQAIINLGNALKDTGQLDEAVAAYRRALALWPNFADIHNNLGSALKDQGQLDEAIAAYRQAIVLKNDFAEARSNLAYALHFHPTFDAHGIFAELRRWDREIAGPLKSFIPPHRNDRDPDRQLRIGYVSPDFRDQVVGRNLVPLFRERDRRLFEITCYSQVLRPDALTSRFQRMADRFRDIRGLSDERVAGQVREDRIDILVDLTLHMSHNRLGVFARKPAPVQLTFAGYPGSTGLSTIDYRLSDPWLDPPGTDESVYSEQTIRLPNTFWCYDPLDCVDIPVNPLPAPRKGVVTFGCLNNFCKVNRPVLTLWARVLRSVEGSRLMLLASAGSHRQQTLAFLNEQGIDMRRVDFFPFQPRRQYLELYHLVDLGLDTFPYNGHTTTLDSHWMGVPVVTLVGQTPVSRAGWCQLSNLGLTELAGYSPEQFVRIASDLAGDLPRLSSLRSSLRQRMAQSPLMDAPRFARDIEAAYRRMWRTWCQGPSLAERT
jgi:predicted O-linked N-acetylglucosamine transferase (SPINDLY family)